MLQQGFYMAKKGQEKNTKNKAKHNKLMQRKKNKLKSEKELRAERLKAIIKKPMKIKPNEEQ